MEIDITNLRAEQDEDTGDVYVYFSYGEFSQGRMLVARITFDDSVSWKSKDAAGNIIIKKAFI